MFSNIQRRKTGGMTLVSLPPVTTAFLRRRRLGRTTIVIIELVSEEKETYGLTSSEYF
jgi:hypothetical protein